MLYLSNSRQQLLSDEQAREVEAILSNNKELPISREVPQNLLVSSERWSQTTDGYGLDQKFITNSSPHHYDSTILAEPLESTSHSYDNIRANTSDDQLISSLEEADVLVDESFQMEYPPMPSREVFVNQDGVHFFEDGNFWMEVPGLLENDRDDDEEDNIPVKKGFKIKFSTEPIRVFSTFSVNDYDRRNENVDPVAASAEYELEKRVEKMDVFTCELMKGPEGLGLSIIGSKRNF